MNNIDTWCLTMIALKFPDDNTKKKPTYFIINVHKYYIGTGKMGNTSCVVFVSYCYHGVLLYLYGLYTHHYTLFFGFFDTILYCVLFLAFWA